MADSLIPGSIRDAGSAGFEQALEHLAALDLTPLLIYIIDNVSASALPHLLEQFHMTGAEGSRIAANDGDRRGLIKGSFDAHRYKGTRYAIRRAVESMGLTITILEWWQYAAAPHHFKVTIDLFSQELTAGQQSLLDAYINEYKPARSILDGITFNYSVDSAVPVIGVSLQSSEIITVYP